MSSVDEIRAQAIGVAAAWSAEDAPDSWRLTAELFRVIAAHEELLRRLAGLPSDPASGAAGQRGGFFSSAPGQAGAARRSLPAARSAAAAVP